MIARLLRTARVRAAAARARAEERRRTCHCCWQRGARPLEACRTDPDGVPYTWHCVEERWCRFVRDRAVDHAIARGRMPRTIIVGRGCPAPSPSAGGPLTVADAAAMFND